MGGAIHATSGLDEKRWRLCSSPTFRRRLQGIFSPTRPSSPKGLRSCSKDVAGSERATGEDSRFFGDARDGMAKGNDTAERPE